MTVAPAFRASLLAAALVGCASKPPPAVSAPLGPRPDSEVSAPAKGTTRAAQGEKHETSDADSAHARGSAYGSWRTAGWITLGFAGVAAAVTGGTSYLMLHDDHVRDGACNDAKQCTIAGAAANSRLSSLVGWNIGAWVATGVAAGVGTILVLTHPVKKADEPAKQTAIGVSPTLAGAALTVRGELLMHTAYTFAVALAGMAGCVLVTGGGDGYTTIVDAAALSAPTADSCAVDASSCVVVGCSSSTECLLDDAGTFGACCLTETLTPIGAALACQASACDPSTQSQVCATSAECPVGIECQTHACTLAGTSVTFKTCGTFTCPTR